MNEPIPKDIIEKTVHLFAFSPEYRVHKRGKNFIVCVNQDKEVIDFVNKYSDFVHVAEYNIDYDNLEKYAKYFSGFESEYMLYIIKGVMPDWMQQVIINTSSFNPPIIILT